jgi:hypothetical protein
MALNLASPGIINTEIDKSASIDTQTTKIAVVVLPAEVGETNKIIYCSSESDIIANFGKPTNENYTEWFSALEVTGYGITIGIIRPDDATTNLNTANITTSGYDNALSLSGTDGYQTNQNNYIFAARTPSDKYNDLSIAVIDRGADQILTINATSGTSNPVVGDIVKNGNTMGWIYSVNSNGYTVLLDDSTKKFKTNDILYIEDGTTIIGTITGITDFYSTQYIAPNVPWLSIAPQPGTSAQAKEKGARFDEFHAVVIDTTGKISGNVGGILESFTYLSKAIDGVSAEGADTYWKRIIQNRSKYIFAGVQTFDTGNNVSLDIPTNSNYVIGDIGTPITKTLFKPFKNNTGGASIKLSLSGGRSYNWTTPSVVDAIIESGYDLVADAEVFNDVDFLVPGKITGQRISKLVNICERRRDCRVAVAPQYSDVINSFNSTTKVSNIINFYDTLPSSSFMIFCDNYKYIFDKYNNTYRYIPCAADVVGLTLTTLNSWQSPAGLTHGVLKNAIKLAYSAKKSERDQLYSHRINPIISYPGKGVILNGDKTALSSPSAFDRIGVRGLMIEIQKVISQFAESVMFETNDEITRKSFVDNVTPYLSNIQSERGIYEFRVVCDTTNNTTQNIDANEFIADFYIKPSRNINFIGLNYVITASGATFSDNLI